MSFILDALRKSEHQRHREIAPALPELRIVQRESKMPLVLGGVAALLVVNLVVVLAVYLRQDARPAAAPVAPPVAAPAAPAPAAGAPVAPRPARPFAEPAVRPLVEEALPVAPDTIEPPPVRATPSDGTPARVGDGNRPHVRRLAEGGSDLDDAAAAQQQAMLERAPGGSQSRASLPTINELGPQATAGLPQLGISLHVYGSDPAQRFVIINGRRYQEGERLPEGPVVEHITPDGVIMNHKGTRFLLPRE